MALSKDKKKAVIEEIGNLLSISKLTVLATYKGTSVKAMQELRRQGRNNGTQVHVVKNRLVIKALDGNDNFKTIDKSVIKGQLLYAFNSEDEVAPAQTIAKFAKSGAAPLEFVGAITSEGVFIDSEDVKALASLPSKDQLRSMLVGTLAAPLSSFVYVLSGNVRGVLNVLSARAEAIK